jgi:hypothetical protein
VLWRKHYPGDERRYAESNLALRKMCFSFYDGKARTRFKFIYTWPHLYHFHRALDAWSLNYIINFKGLLYIKYNTYRNGSRLEHSLHDLILLDFMQPFVCHVYHPCQSSKISRAIYPHRELRMTLFEFIFLMSS